jgi:hypothetical protein
MYSLKLFLAFSRTRDNRQNRLRQLTVPQSVIGGRPSHASIEVIDLTVDGSDDEWIDCDEPVRQMSSSASPQRPPHLSIDTSHSSTVSRPLPDDSEMTAPVTNGVTPLPSILRVPDNVRTISADSSALSVPQIVDMTQILGVRCFIVGT